MSEKDELKAQIASLKAQLYALRDVATEYRGRTIENIIVNIEARIKAKEEQQ